MKKHTLVLLLISALTLILCTSCCTKSENSNSKTSKTTKATITTTKDKEPVADANKTEVSSIDKALATEAAIEYDIPDRQTIDRTNADVMKVLNAYKSVLTNQASFLCTYNNKNMLLNQFIDSLADAFTSKIAFAIIDLDNDGISEIILRFLNTSSQEHLSSILRYEDENIYEFTFSARQFGYLKIDGTFNSSGSTSDKGFNTISFEKNTHAIIPFTYSESNLVNSEPSILYYVNQRQATKEEFDSAFDYELNKPDVTWYEFSQENIEKYFS